MEQKNDSKIVMDALICGARDLGLTFSEELKEKFSIYYDELCHWDRSVNLTGLRTDLERTVLLFVDSLAANLALSSFPFGKIMDIGSGGGFPGIPLKLALPDLTMILMEPRNAKTAFLRYIIGKLALHGISVLQRRLEHCPALFNEEEKCDVAICKGVNMDHLLPHLHHILKKDGTLVVFRAKNIENLHRMKKMKLIQEITYELPFGFGSRVLALLKYDT